MLFVTIGPIETGVIFASPTAGIHRRERRSLALRSTMIAGLVLLLFALGGSARFRSTPVGFFSLQRLLVFGALGSTSLP